MTDLPALKRGRGRPKLVIDPTLVEGMASVGASNRMIAEFLGCDETVLRRRFADVIVKAHARMFMN